jgi:parallel beta-helix repeat protein
MGTAAQSAPNMETPMKRLHLILPSLGLGLAVLAWSSLREQTSLAQPPAATLAGARPSIEAERYPTIQAAIDALPAEGGVVRLPAGTFEIDEPLLLTREDVLLEGAGTATCIKNVNTSGKPALIVQPAKLAADRKAMQWRVKLADVRILGNPRSGHGIQATNVDELFIDGVTVSAHGGDGIHMENCYEDPRISDCLITYNKKVGLNLIGCHDIVVSANQFEENQDAVRCADGFNLCMTGNCVDDHLRDGVVIENTYGSVVAGNMIEECKGTAIILDRDCYGITLSANVIAHEEAGGIDLRDAHGCTVGANTFTIVKQNALVIGPESGRITVTGNNFSDSTISPGAVKRLKNDLGASGLTLAGTSDVAVSGNLFAGLAPRGVAVAGEPSRRVLFSGNVLTDAASEHAKLRDSLVGDNLEAAPAASTSK